MESNRKITSVVYKKRMKKCIITFSDGEELICFRDLVLKYNLSKGRLVGQAMAEKIIEEQRIYEVKQAAHNYASYKPRTRFQVIKKLKEKGFSDKEIAPAMKFLREFDLLDDEKYAKNFISDFLARKPAGKARVRIELLKRGVGKDIIENALTEYFPDEYAYDMALAAIEKKMRTLINRPPDKQKSSVISFLQRQGFSWDIIRRATDEIFHDE